MLYTIQYFPKQVNSPLLVTKHHFIAVTLRVTRRYVPTNQPTFFFYLFYFCILFLWYTTTNQLLSSKSIAQPPHPPSEL